MSSTKYVMPLCFGASGSVRANKMPSSLWCAPELQTFCPSTTHSSPSRTARVRSPARSDPAPGSLNSWHHTSSPRSSEGRYRCFCASVPCAISVGATIPMPTANTPTSTSKRACSRAKMRACAGVPPRPPYSLGQAMPAQPPSNSVRCQALPRRTCSASASGLGSPRKRNLAKSSSPGRRRRACNSRNARARARNASSGSSGAPSSGTCRRHDRLQLDVVAEPLDAELAPDARPLVAAERRHEVHRVLVHAVRAGAHAPGDVDTLVDVARPHRSGEAVLTVVGDADGVVGRVVRDDRENGPEDLLARDAHRVVDAGEHRRLDVPTLVQSGRTAVAPHGDLRPFLLADGDVLLDPFLLTLGDERTDLRRFVLRIADRELADHARHGVDDCVVAVAAGADARLRDARLAVVHERGELEPLDGGREISVVEDDRSRLPAELEAHPLELLTADRRDAAAGRGRARERDLVDAGMAHEVLADLTAGR